MFEKSLQPPRDHTQHCSQQLRIRLMPSKNKIAHVEVRPSPVCAADSEQVAHISQRMSTNDPMKDAPFHWDMQSGHLWPTSWHVAGGCRQVPAENFSASCCHVLPTQRPLFSSCQGVERFNLHDMANVRGVNNLCRLGLEERVANLHLLDPWSPSLWQQRISKRSSRLEIRCSLSQKKKHHKRQTTSIIQQPSKYNIMYFEKERLPENWKGFRDIPMLCPQNIKEFRAQDLVDNHQKACFSNSWHVLPGEDALKFLKMSSKSNSCAGFIWILYTKYWISTAFLGKLHSKGYAAIENWKNNNES